MQKRCACLILVWLALAGFAWGQEGELRMAMSGAFAPFSTIDEQGQLVGFDADIARALATAMGRRPVLVQVDWSGIQAGLQSGKYDLICGSMAITPERLERMHFSLPYYVSGAQVFAFDHPPKRYGVTEDSTYAGYIREHPQQFGGAEVVYYGSEAEILTAMRADKIDGFVSDRIVGGFYLSRAGAPDIAPQGELLYQEACGIAARLDDPELVRQVNAALLELVQSGQYGAIYRKWVGSEPDFKTLFRQWGAFSQDIPKAGQAAPKTAEASHSGLGDTLTLLARGALLTIELSLLTACLSMLTGLM
ncbi:MAG: amino acid ABC transporter substrate-binding protein, partial [Candidatus Eremiobacteraeota bacterium]|nr:amino acid ABC transporter substrate-binding protein [Candidatus Eremiobacteraeota bacterium]